ncbi:MAG: hypothetical protein KI786_01580 [Mameliella sp.]|nr:hypothetical protein [Phaeodactylibacter sp.]
MHTWNTIKAVSTNKLDRAIEVLETLERPVSSRILEFLRTNGKSNLTDIALHTQYNAEALEAQLDKLCFSRAIHRHEDILGCHYTINAGQLFRTRKSVQALAALYKE